MLLDNALSTDFAKKNDFFLMPKKSTASLKILIYSELNKKKNYDKLNALSYKVPLCLKF